MIQTILGASCMAATEEVVKLTAVPQRDKTFVKMEQEIPELEKIRSAKDIEEKDNEMA